MNYRIEELSKDNEKDWENFTIENSDCSFFHTLYWKRVLEESFNYKARYFMVFYHENVIAICPYFISQIGICKGLRVLPNSDYNNIVIAQGDHSNILEYIHKHCLKIAKDENLSFNVITTFNKSDYDILFEKFKYFDYPTNGIMELKFDKYNPDDLWNRFFSDKHQQRRFIRRFVKDGFEVKYVDNFEELERFYYYYKKNMEEFKRNAYPLRHFQILCDIIPRNWLKISLLVKDEVVAGGILSISFPPRNTEYLRYLSLNRELPTKYSPSYYLYWDTIRNAHSNGCKVVCYGATPLDPTHINYKFKMKFGAEYFKKYALIYPIDLKFYFQFRIWELISKIIKKLRKTKYHY